MPVALYAEERSTTVPFLIALTVSTAVTVRVIPPEVPAMVIVEAASFEESAAVRVILLVLAAPAGLKDAVTPGGNPDTLKLTLDLKFPRRVTVTAVVVLRPFGMAMWSAVVLSAKS